MDLKPFLAHIKEELLSIRAYLIKQKELEKEKNKNKTDILALKTEKLKAIDQIRQLQHKTKLLDKEIVCLEEQNTQDEFKELVKLEIRSLELFLGF